MGPLISEYSRPGEGSIVFAHERGEFFLAPAVEEQHQRKKNDPIQNGIDEHLIGVVSLRLVYSTIGRVSPSPVPVTDSGPIPRHLAQVRDIAHTAGQKNGAREGQGVSVLGKVGVVARATRQDTTGTPISTIDLGQLGPGQTSCH